MHNIFFAWDEAYTRAELAILSEIGRSYRTAANNEEKSCQPYRRSSPKT
jgi:hypothetical protein